MKNNIFRTLAVLMLALAMALTSCGPTADNSSVADTSSIGSSGTVDANAYTLNSVALDQYQIVYANDAYGYAKEFAEDLEAGLEDIADIDIKTVADTEAETEHEIIVGDTNRDVNFKMSTMDPLTYGYAAEGTKVVLNAGALYTIELAVDKMLDQYTAGRNLTVSEEAIKTKVEFTEPKNIIMLIGDGMGKNHIEYTLANGLGGFAAKLLPAQANVTTRSTSSVTDSAASATALSGGYKTDNGVVGKKPDLTDVTVMGELVKEKNKELLILTTDSITGATPAGFTAHADARGSSDVIAACQEKIGALVLEGSIDKSNTTKAFLDAIEKYENSGNQNGFFMMYEEAATDWGGHNNEFDTLRDGVIRLNDVVRNAISYVLHNPDTVLLITADHETGGILYTEKKGWLFTSKNHTGKQVPLFALGYGTETFNGKSVDNTEISKFMAHIVGDSNWGDPSIPLTIELPKMSR